MVVQHNLTAMNSNRMLGVTTKGQAKTTEKLSSGYKINRAADDAAGLAISEKMRKQIRGLTQASANAQDGISAVQTAEGALTEVQDMLQRMNELAVKASNGTQSESDRASIQAEIDQLATEIDRVSETTKFNETYLLKGDQTVTKGYSYSYNAVSGSNVTASATMDQDAATKLTAQIEFKDGAKAADQNALAKALRDQGITINAKQKEVENEDGTKTKQATYSVTLNGSAANTYKINTKKDTGTADAKTDKTDFTGAAEFEVVDMQGNKIADIKVSGGIGDDVAAESSKVITANKVGAAENKGDVAQFYDADGNVISENALSNYFSKLSGTAIATAGSVDLAKDVFGADGTKYTAGEATAATAAYNILESGGKLYTKDPRTANAMSVVTSNKGVNLGTGSTGAQAGNKYEYYAAGYDLPNGTKVTTGGWYDMQTWKLSPITGGVKPATGGAIYEVVLDNTLVATAASYTYTASVKAGGVAAQAGKQLYDAVGNAYDGKANSKTMANIAETVASNQNLTGALALSLHVGADATRNNQIDLKLDAMSAKGLGINGIRVDGKNDSNALKSVETIKEALAKVSSQRSALGAVQNRLEHTINNLDNVVENTTSAESAIRDTDMATTMVQYSKNNILAQAGTSMLAQANQSNQSVLSLLQ